MSDEQLSRIRIDTIRELVANHKGDDERSQFKVTPYKLLQYGVIPPKYIEEFENIFDEKERASIVRDAFDLKDKTPNTPLSLQEQLSYSMFFVMNPSKVCGETFISSSGAFPVKVKGSRADVERVINATLNAKKESLSAEQRIRVALALAKARARIRQR